MKEWNPYPLCVWLAVNATGAFLTWAIKTGLF